MARSRTLSQRLLDWLARCPRPTLFGWLALSLAIISLALAIWATANNRVSQINYAYVLLSLTVALLLLSWPLGRWNLRQITARRQHPQHAVSGEPFRVSLIVRNHGWLPRLGLFIEDGLPSVVRKEARSAYIAGIPPHGGVAIEYDGMLFRRGLTVLRTVTLVSSFPFGLFEWRRDIPCETRILVYPPIGQMTTPLRMELGRQMFVDGVARRQRDGVENYFGVREYHVGDLPRFIHWKASARRGGLWVKEFEDTVHAPLLVILDTKLLQPRARRGAYDGEIGVALAATLATHAVRHGRALALCAFRATSAPLIIPPGFGRHHLIRLLDELARLRTGSKESVENLLECLGFEFFHMHAAVVLLGPRPFYKIDRFQRAFQRLTIFSAQDDLVRQWLKTRDTEDWLLTESDDE